MLSIGLTLLTVVLTALGSVESDELLAIADLSYLSNTPRSAQLTDKPSALRLRGDDAIDHQDLQAPEERDLIFGPYSRYSHKNTRYQWIFRNENATTQYNISISTCIKMSEIAGVYQFVNGSTSTSATVGDIYTDLGYGSDLANPDKMIAHTLVNAQAAYNDISTFLLDTILCNSNLPLRDELRRQLLSGAFRSDRRIMTLILQGVLSTGIYFFWNGIGLTFDHPGIKMVFGGIATLNLIIVVGVLEILPQEGVIQPYEMAFVGSVYVARARILILKATQIGRAGGIAGPCLTTTELPTGAAHAGSGSAPAQDLGVVGSGDVPEIQTCPPS